MTALKTDLVFLARLLRDPGERRHAARWWRSRNPHWLLDQRLPWLVFDAVDILRERPLERRNVFEFGSGGSTLFWQAHGALCVSVEHDAEWYAATKARLAAQPPVDYRLIPPDTGDIACPGDPADPDSYASSDEELRGKRFRRYASAIDSFPDGYFDVVLVDGRARPSCLKHSVGKVAVGGLLILDNSERPHYLARTASQLRCFRETRLKGPCAAAPVISCTSLFQRVG